MTTENNITTAAGGELIEIGGTASVPAAPPVNPLLVAHSLLRGRYPWVICLAVIGAAIGAPLGYIVQQPVYKSVGVILVQPDLPKILYPTEQNGIMPMYDAYLASQIAEIQNRQIVLEAMNQPEWMRFARGLSPEAIAKFEESLEVSSQRGSPAIQVAFSDQDPKAAQVAVKAVIESYDAHYGNAELESENSQMKVLQVRRQDEEGELDRLNTNIGNLASDFGGSSLERPYQQALSELERVRSQLADIHLKTLAAESAAAPSTAPASQPSDSMIKSLFLRDEELRGLSRQEEQTAEQIAVLETVYSANHPKMKEIEATLQMIRNEINERKMQLTEESKLPAPLSTPGSTIPLNIEQLKATEDALSRENEKLKKEVSDLANKNWQIEKYQEQAQEQRELLAETKARIQALELEKQGQKRIQIISKGDIPFTPDKDRRKALAAVGGMGLASIGIGFVMLIGFLDRRMHNIDSARSQLKRTDRMLGVLPELPTDLTDVEQASAAAYCVHHIRAMLQIRQRATGDKVFAITSPSPGDGKTSLTITLGMSLAASGCKTLVLDADMDGGGLTSRLGRLGRRPLGQILLDNGSINQAKLDEGLQLALEKHVRLGRALRALSYVSRELVHQALEQQRGLVPGLASILNGAPIERAIVATGYPLLSMLPVGSPTSAHSTRVSPEAIRRLLDRLAGQFDIVLVDCAPVLGSVEAAIISAEADGVILVLSRGGDRAVAERAANFLVAADAKIEGVVFNRAEQEDMAKSAYNSSSSARSARNDGKSHDAWAKVVQTATQNATDRRGAKERG